MTVPAQDTRVTYTASGASSTFAYPFLIQSNADLLVYVDEVEQTLTTDYTVTGVGTETGGNVVFTSAPAANAIVVIMRNMAYQRTAYDYQNAGDFRATTINADLDAVVMQIQQLAEKISRAPLLSVATTLAALAFPSPGAGQYIRWNNAGTALEAVSSTVSSGTFLQSGTGAVTREANAKMAEIVSITDFDAVGDDATDCTTALVNAIDSLPAGGGTVWLPGGGAFRISALDLTGKMYIAIEGDGGRTQSSIRWTSTTGNVVNLTSARFVTFRNLNFLPAAQKTSGALFYAPATASDLTFENLRISSAYIGFDLDGATNVFLRHIDLLDYNASWAWNSALRVGLNTQSASIHVDDFTFATQTTLTGQSIWINNVDTFIARDLNVQKQGAGAALGVYITGGEFIQFHQCHMECGSASVEGFYVAGGNNIDFIDCHATSSIYGWRITGGSGIQIIGGRSYYNGRHGVLLAGGSNIIVKGVLICDNNTSAGTWDGIRVAAGVDDFSLLGNTIASVRGTPVPVNYGIYIEDGDSTNYVVANNKISNYSTAALYDGGTGAIKSIAGNPGASLDKPLCHANLTTNDATQSTLWSFGLSDESTYYVKAVVIGQDSATNTRVAYERTCLAYRNGGAATIEGQTSIDTIESNAAFDCTFDVSVNSVRLRVTGAAATTVRWRGRLEVYQVGALS